jgi:hypothetical protein
MKPFFVHTHLGIDVGFWNDFISSHKRIQSNYDVDNYRIYSNSNLEDLIPKRNKWYFSRARWFDILLHNYQVGYRYFYQDFKHIIIFGSFKEAEKKIFDSRLYEKPFCQNYMNLRFQRLKYICNKCVMPLVIVEGLCDSENIRKKLCNYLEIPFEFEKPVSQQPAYDHDDQLSDFILDLHDKNKILLAV